MSGVAFVLWSFYCLAAGAVIGAAWLTRQSDFVPFSPCAERQWAEAILALLPSEHTHEETT